MYNQIIHAPPPSPCRYYNCAQAAKIALKHGIHLTGTLSSSKWDAFAVEGTTAFDAPNKAIGQTAVAVSGPPIVLQRLSTQKVAGIGAPLQRLQTASRQYGRVGVVSSSGRDAAGFEYRLLPAPADADDLPTVFDDIGGSDDVLLLHRAWSEDVAVVLTAAQSKCAAWSMLRRCSGPTASQIGGPLLTMYQASGQHDVLSGLQGSSKLTMKRDLSIVWGCIGQAGEVDPDTVVAMLNTTKYTVASLKDMIKDLEPGWKPVGQMQKEAVCRYLAGMEGFDPTVIFDLAAQWRTAATRLILESWFPRNLKLQHLSAGLANEKRVTAEFLPKWQTGQAPGTNSEIPLHMRIHRIEHPGLVESRIREAQASPDGVMAVSFSGDDTDGWAARHGLTEYCGDGGLGLCGLEIKTRFGEAAIAGIFKIADAGFVTYVVDLSVVGDRARWRKLQPRRRERTQILMCVCAIGIGLWLFLETTTAGIVYAVLVIVPDMVRDAFQTAVLDVLHHEVVEPLVAELKKHESPSRSKVLSRLNIDMGTVCTDESLKYQFLMCRALRRYATKHGPIPRTKTIVPRAIDEWNKRMPSCDRVQQDVNKLIRRAAGNQSLEGNLHMTRLALALISFQSAATLLALQQKVGPDVGLGEAYKDLRAFRRARINDMSVGSDLARVALEHLATGHSGGPGGAPPPPGTEQAAPGRAGGDHLDNSSSTTVAKAVASGSVYLRGSPYCLNLSRAWNGALKKSRTGQDHTPTKVKAGMWVLQASGHLKLVQKLSKNGAVACNGLDCCTYCSQEVEHGGLPRRPKETRYGCTECAADLMAMLGIRLPAPGVPILMFCGGHGQKKRFSVQWRVKGQACAQDMTCWELHHSAVGVELGGCVPCSDFPDQHVIPDQHVNGSIRVGGKFAAPPFVVTNVALITVSAKKATVARVTKLQLAKAARKSARKPRARRGPGDKAGTFTTRDGSGGGVGSSDEDPGRSSSDDDQSVQPPPTKKSANVRPSARKVPKKSANVRPSARKGPVPTRTGKRNPIHGGDGRGGLSKKPRAKPAVKSRSSRTVTVAKLYSSSDPGSGSGSGDELLDAQLPAPKRSKKLVTARDPKRRKIPGAAAKTVAQPVRGLDGTVVPGEVWGGDASDNSDSDVVDHVEPLETTLNHKLSRQRNVGAVTAALTDAARNAASVASGSMRGPAPTFRPTRTEGTRWYRHFRDLLDMSIAEANLTCAAMSGFDLLAESISHAVPGNVTVKIVDKYCTGGDPSTLVEATTRLTNTLQALPNAAVYLECEPAQMGPSCGYQAAAAAARTMGTPSRRDAVMVTTADVSDGRTLFQRWNKELGLKAKYIHWLGAGDVMRLTQTLYMQLVQQAHPSDSKRDKAARNRARGDGSGNLVTSLDVAARQIAAMLASHRDDPSIGRSMHIITNDQVTGMGGHHWVYVYFHVAPPGGVQDLPTAEDLPATVRKITGPI